MSFETAHVSMVLLAAGLGLGLAWRDETHRPLALALVALFCIEQLHGELGAALAFERDAGRIPYVGGFRGLFLARQALFLSIPALDAGLLLLFLGDLAGALALAVTWALLATVIVALYPALRGDDLLRVDLGWQAACLVIAALAFVIRARPRRPLTPQALAALVLVGGDLAGIAGPWAHDPVSSWWLARVPSVIFWGGLIVLLGGISWTRMKSAGSSWKRRRRC